MIKMKRRMGTRVPAAECLMPWDVTPPDQFTALMRRMWVAPSCAEQKRLAELPRRRKASSATGRDRRDALPR